MPYLFMGGAGQELSQSLLGGGGDSWTEVAKFLTGKLSVVACALFRILIASQGWWACSWSVFLSCWLTHT